MRSMLRILGLGVAMWLAGAGVALAVDSTWNYAVEITASVQASPAQIALSWKQDTNGAPNSYTIFRKAPSASSWGSAIGSVSGGTTSFTDTNVSVGTVYEYQVFKDASALGYTGYGYIEAAINAPVVDNRGTVILVVDSTFSSALASELGRLQQDLVGDGWKVIRHDVGRGDSVTSVKALIKADYTADPANVNTVFLFGHVPVPYSGQLNPDGHPEHLGAWPADVYYADMDGTWTDTTVNYHQTDNTDPADGARLTNVPGDGKFDQSTIPADLKLKIGRVDLSNMPGYLQYDSDASFPSEQELLRQYLNKDHAFRQATLSVHRRSIVGDYIGNKEGLAVAASAFRSFSPIVGSGNLTNLNIQYNDEMGHWVPTLKDNDYLLALGCGAGAYTTVAGIGTRPPYYYATTTDIVSNDVRAVFVMMFGSWCGDWDHQDNIVRGVLATPTYGLASMYTGVPHWYLHPLGLGETIGTCALLTQNNSNLYQTFYDESHRGIHIALMGDPTLRAFPATPASNLSASYANGQATLHWSASGDQAISSYHVYRATSAGGPFTRITSSPVSATSYTDASAPANATYMVRAIKLETTPSGTFYNPSAGIVAAVGNGGTGGTDTGGGGNTGGTGGGTPGARLINLSVLHEAGGGLTMGFVVRGSGTKKMVLRGVGPTLTNFGVGGPLADPKLELFRSSTSIGTNDNWGGTSTLQADFSSVGAFALPNDSKDAALSVNLTAADYSARVTGPAGATGSALIEAYDADTSSDARLVNLSALTYVDANTPLTAGFVVRGGTKTLLIRGVGPGLATVGVSGYLNDPSLTVYRGSTSLTSNNDWAGDASIKAAASAVGAFTLPADSSKDSAVLVTVDPGDYSATVRASGGDSGTVILEIYEVQ